MTTDDYFQLKSPLFYFFAKRYRDGLTDGRTDRQTKTARFMQLVFVNGFNAVKVLYHKRRIHDNINKILAPVLKYIILGFYLWLFFLIFMDASNHSLTCFG